MDYQEINGQAVKILKQGGIIIFPTDTAFGIGCRMDNPNAVNRLYDIRKRPRDQQVPVLVDSMAMAEKYYATPLPDNVRHLLNRYWPGALTVVYFCRQAKIPPLVIARGKTIGLRMPNHNTVLALINGVGVPILGPSANFHGEKTPFNLHDLDKNLIKLVDYVVPGVCKAGNVSTVVDATRSPLKIIRPGAVKLDACHDIL